MNNVSKKKIAAGYAVLLAVFIPCSSCTGKWRIL